MTKLSPAQTAARLGISREWVIELANAGRIPCEMTPLGRLFRADDVERIRAEREANPPRLWRQRAAA